MAGSNLYTAHPTIANLDVSLVDADGLVIQGKCTGTPDTTANIYADGAIIQRTDAGSGNRGIYENTGTSASPSWDLVGEIGSADLSAGALSADATGRAIMENGYFDTPSTVADKFTNGSFGGDALQDDSVRAGKLKTPAGPGSYAKKYIVGYYDFSVDGGSQGTFDLGGGETFDDTYVVTNAYYGVETTLTSATDAATVALHIEGADDLVAAVAISNGGNPWDSTGSLVQAIPDGTVGNMLILSDTRSLTMTVAVEDLTAGKLFVVLEVIQV